jgi:alkylation response protein AidB-like acyl-CoA dehydrogenase
MLDPVATARALRPRLREASPAIERARRLPADMAAQLSAEGLFRLLAPRSAGGLEVHPQTFVDALAALAEGDGATAWIAMTSSTTGLLYAYLDEAGRVGLDAEAPLDTAPLAGIFAPSGKAVATDGGYRLSGRWSYASGCDNATHRLVGGLVLREGAPPEHRLFFLPPDADVEVLDTWRVLGLRGTGSHDLVAEDVFVPAERTCTLSDGPLEEGPLYRFPLFGLLALGVSAVGLGLARRALQELLRLAGERRSRGGTKGMAEQEHVQLGVARAEAKLAAAEALVATAIGESWAAAEATEALSDHHKARLRLAATHAAETSAEVVATVHRLAAGAAIREDGALARIFRDVHVMSQHLMVGVESLKPVGRILLGLPTDTRML